jgi:putative phosphoesterase
MLAIVSDSHIPKRADEIPGPFLELLEEADRVVHCGDFDSEQFYDLFTSRFDTLTAVKGNCDFFDLPSSETFIWEGVTFGVYHGTGITPRGHHPTLVDIASNKLDVEVLFHGHTHEEEIARKGDVVLANPGSCTGVGGGSSSLSDPTMLLVRMDGDDLLFELLGFDSEKEEAVTVEEQTVGV